MTQPTSDTFDRIAVPYDRGMAPLERLWLRELRGRLMPHANGKILEVGVGTGANLPFYDAAACLTAVDESPDMLEIASRRASSLNRPFCFSQTDVEHLGFPSGHFDTAVASLVLCSVVNQHRALSELSRVLRRPGGKLLLIEHMRPYRGPAAWLADLANIPWYAFNGRCQLNRETEQTLLQVGFKVERLDSKLGGLLRLIVASTI
jgi:ubiquinone/menaquinone biosynthesis C-methylase UbiE